MHAPGTDDAPPAGPHPGPDCGRGGLIAALCSSSAYPHRVTLPIRVQETHISWVLLTGPYAYKIKKPVRLSFLDYSTLARRRFCCEEELRLNRRCAPGLYLDVVAIGGPAEAPRIGGPAESVLEYAVRMLQFDTREELDALVAAGTVQAPEVASLGQDLARFHAAAARTAGDAPYGTPARVHQVTQDNFAELMALHPAGLDVPAVSALRAASEARFAALAPLMAGRRDSGWVRECHGDLHCANVVRWQGRLTPFDGIEFDPGLRFVDTVNDFAFLSMDLAARGRRDLRHAALNAWAEVLGDYAGLELLPYYETYRALVRAKVAALRAQQARDDAAALASAIADVGRYIDWATAQSARPRPRLLITCGLSGSGKTWLARQLAAALGAMHIRSDVERKRLAGLTPLASSRSAPDAGIYTRDFNARTYGRLAECARACLRGGEDVIVDAAFLRRGERGDLLTVAREQGFDARIVHCTAPLDELKRRVAARHAARSDASEADVELLDRQPSYWEPLTPGEVPLTVTADSTDPQALPAVLAQLQRTGL